MAFFTQWDAVFNAVTAGVLVFAIAPLSRLADRLAEKVVPVAAVPAGHSSGPRETGSVDAVYRAAVRAAMRDGVLTRREEVHLVTGRGKRGALGDPSEVQP